MKERELGEAIGLADALELLQAAFLFPSEQLARALTDGSFRNDVEACLADAHVPEETIRALCDDFSSLEGRDPVKLLARLRKGQSLLYVRQAKGVAVFPYESAFLHVQSGHEGAPALFRTLVTLDVESQMREAGVVTKDSRTEPCDSVWNELSFLSFLYGSLAQTLHEGSIMEDAEVWQARIMRFWTEHGSVWLSAFFEATQAQAAHLSHGTEYSLFARLGLAVIAIVEADVIDRAAEAR